MTPQAIDWSTLQELSTAFHPSRTDLFSIMQPHVAFQYQYPGSTSLSRAHHHHRSRVNPSNPLGTRRSALFYRTPQHLLGRPAGPALNAPNHHHYHHSRPPPRAQTTDHPSQLRAKEHRTGQFLTLIPAQTPAAPDASRRFVVCPACATAYLGNAISKPVHVLCPACQETFSASPETLFVQPNIITPLVQEQQHRHHKPPTTNQHQQPPPSPEKLDNIVCPHFALCPGCTVENNVSQPPILAKIQEFARGPLRLNKPVTVEMLSPIGWRTHAKLAIRPAGVGLFRLRSHDVLNIPKCVVHHPKINEAIKALEKALLVSSIKPYHEQSGTGGPRYALFTVERHSERVQVTIVWNAANWKDSHPHASRVAMALWNDNRKLLHSVWFNWNRSRGNVIVSSKYEAFYLAHGEEFIWENIRGAQIAFPPSVFRQANLDAFEKLLLPRLLSYIPPRSAIFELFAGVGVISLAALAEPDLELRSLTCTEINELAEVPFKRSLRRLGMHSKIPVKFIVGSDDDVIHEATMADTDLVILDPPRAGASNACMDALSNLPQTSSIRRIIYLSCGFEGFRRDCSRLLTGSTRWVVRNLHGYMLFPGSDHVELLAVFDRRL